MVEDSETLQAADLAKNGSMEGYLRKNHNSLQFSAKNNIRYFTTSGFTVFYYESEKRSKPKGHFDLRNVLTVKPTEDAGAGVGAIELKIGDPKGQVAKRMVVSFTPASTEQRAAWLTLWCSAVSPDGVEHTLREYINPPLSAKLNSEYGGTSAVAPRRSLLSKAPSTTTVLTPRSQVTTNLRMQYGDAAAPPYDSSGYDTPRGSLQPPRAGEPLPRPEGQPPVPPPKKAEVKGEADEVTFEITVPSSVQPGDKLQATTPSGVKVKLAVPEGAEPGTILTFSLPASVGFEDKQAKAAVLIQARVRGAKSRSSLSASKEAAAPAGSESNPIVIKEEPELVLAAIKLQKSYRGHSVRNEQQEASRLQWMAYYMQPEVAEWGDALALAVSPEEEQLVHAARAGIEYEEENRLKWFRFYVSNGEFDRAAELVVTEVEAALVIRSRATAPAKCCACLQGGAATAAAAEEERYQRFVQAIRAYQWEVASTLALTPEEAQDVADSKVRVSAMQQAISTNDTKKALEYAITNDEIEQVHAKAAGR